MRDIRASAEVRALIGAEKLRELQGDSLRAVRLLAVWQGGWTTEPTSVVVLGYRIFRVAKLAHAACADSQIIEVDAAGMRAVASEPTRRNTASTPEEPAGSFAAARTAQARGCPA